jgi:hypothetical protein
MTILGKNTGIWFIFVILQIVDFIISQKTGISSLHPALEILENIVLHR